MFCSHHHKTKISSSDVKMRRVMATEMLKKMCYKQTVTHHWG